MDKGYIVTNLNNNKYDLVGIKLNNGKTCCYWKNKESNNVSSIIVIMNNNSVVDVKNDEICISLDGVTNIEDQMRMLGAFVKELSQFKINVRSVGFQFVVGNDQEEKIAKDIISSLGIKGDVVRSDKRIEEEKKENVVNKAVDGDKTIVASNGMKYTEMVGKSALIANLGVLANNEELKKLYDKYMLENPDIREAFNEGRVSSEQIIEVLQRQLINNKNLKEYELGYANSNDNKSNDMAKVSNEYANDVLGVVNTDIGVVRDDKGSYKTVDDKGNIKNAQVTTTSFNNEGLNAGSNEASYGYKWSGSNNSNNGNNGNNFDNYSEEREQKEENINSYQNGKAKVRVLKKPDVNIYQDNNKSAAFVSLPVIMFIISLLLLIGSGIILFMMK